MSNLFHPYCIQLDLVYRKKAFLEAFFECLIDFPFFFGDDDTVKRREDSIIGRSGKPDDPVWIPKSKVNSKEEEGKEADCPDWKLTETFSDNGMPDSGRYKS